ncbi:mitochondrial nicotinamide adenine dinucleotide transporter SLC25A51 [Malaya genurostris]|uniref:mitochondrial nicotinamide adenine dinucleotide transporter SLC25A51 n=1 Tax=Malaya genurostris TaxID=325434 RepID=UPI0026F3C042|nr:mitochondrial nicotinamide adenine dinucleotide transporter SLC25A51 [Malaya genurostris]XP_058451624.1 mitochondrial nicotinamide adenine dinucleotide transporter SLC25A51 [Malaya genurostris]
MSVVRTGGSEINGRPPNATGTVTSPVPLMNWREFACGWGAAFVNITVTYPIYKMIFRQMLHGVQLRQAFGQLRSEGITYLYRGIFPPLAQRTISLSLMFGVYDGTRRPLVEYCGMGQYSAKTIAGCMAGSVEAILMPFERIQTLLADANYHQKYKNTHHAFRLISIEYGFKELYRGMVPILWRNGPSNAMFFVMREEADQRLPKRTTLVTQRTQEFVAGACIGAFISSVFYPLNVIKVTMQSRLGTPYEGMLVALRQVYNERDRKLRNVYKGVSMNCTRAFFSWGIMNCAYEQLRKVLY